MQLVFIDDRNRGKSERGDLSKSTIKQNAADGEAIRKYLGSDKVFVFGQSYGGMTAQRFAIDYPDSVYGVFVVCSSPSHRMLDTAEDVIIRRRTKEQLELYRNWRSGTATISLLEFLEKMGSLYHYKFNNEVLEANREATLRNEGWSSTELNNYQGHELATYDMIPKLEKIDVPMLIMAGKEDFITAPVHSEELHKAVKGSELHIVERSSHEIMEDRPDYFFPVVEDFIACHFDK